MEVSPASPKLLRSTENAANVEFRDACQLQGIAVQLFGSLFKQIETIEDCAAGNQ